MDQFYKGHRIEVSGWLDGDSWFASLFIYYSKGPQNILVTFAMRASSPSARTLSTSQVSEPAHGSNTRSNRGQEFVISGYTPGNPFDALIAAITRARGYSTPPRSETALCRLCAVKWQESSKDWRSTLVRLLTCRNEADAVGFDQGRDEKLCMTQTGAGCTNRVHGMDAGWSSEAFEVCGVEGG
jgi:hypothetical protein